MLLYGLGKMYCGFLTEYGVVMLYFIDRIPDFLPTGIISVIPEERLIKAERYNRVSDNILCKLAYYVFAYGMEKEYGVPIGSKLRWENAENGKPFFSGYPYINFNISHCEKAVFCGLSNYPIGVDVQDVISDTESLWHMVCTDGERERLKASSEPDKLFTWFWCLKEAYLKHNGTGITDELCRIDFSDFESRSFKKYGLVFSAFEMSGCCFAVCGKEGFAKNDFNNIVI